MESIGYLSVCPVGVSLAGYQQVLLEVHGPGCPCSDPMGGMAASLIS
jgi:hypothetical protein